MEEATTKAAVGRALQDRGPNELERLFGSLMEQDELLRMLENRLQVVSNTSPTEQKEPGRDVAPHIGSAADLVSRHNNKIRKLIEELVI